MLYNSFEFTKRKRIFIKSYIEVIKHRLSCLYSVRTQVKSMCFTLPLFNLVEYVATNANEKLLVLYVPPDERKFAPASAESLCSQQNKSTRCLCRRQSPCNRSAASIPTAQSVNILSSRLEIFQIIHDYPLITIFFFYQLFQHSSLFSTKEIISDKRLQFKAFFFTIICSFMKCKEDY